jgi:hypothetical protein
VQQWAFFFYRKSGTRLRPRPLAQIEHIPNTDKIAEVTKVWEQQRERLINDADAEIGGDLLRAA